MDFLVTQVVTLKGNIRVFARIRPILATDDGGAVVLHAEELSGRVIVTPTTAAAAALTTAAGGKMTKAVVQQFEFDASFGDNMTTERIFAEVADLVTSVLDGYRVCVFAFGATGSGKTYTMQGLNRFTLQRLFAIRDERADDYEYTISCSALEIYNEKLRDLLALKRKRPVPAKPSSTFVPFTSVLRPPRAPRSGAAAATGASARRPILGASSSDDSDADDEDDEAEAAAVAAFYAGTAGSDDDDAAAELAQSGVGGMPSAVVRMTSAPQAAGLSSQGAPRNKPDAGASDDDEVDDAANGSRSARRRMAPTLATAGKVRGRGGAGLLPPAGMGRAQSAPASTAAAAAAATTAGAPGGLTIKQTGQGAGLNVSVPGAIQEVCNVHLSLREWGGVGWSQGVK
jgi:hypothetical protein